MKLESACQAALARPQVHTGAFGLSMSSLPNVSAEVAGLLPALVEADRWWAEHPENIPVGQMVRGLIYRQAIEGVLLQRRGLSLACALLLFCEVRFPQR